MRRTSLQMNKMFVAKVGRTLATMVKRESSVRPSVGRPVGLSVIISLKGRKFHFHAPIGAFV